MVLRSPLFFDARARLIALAAQHRLPAMYGWRAYVDAGGLMAYGANLVDMNRRASTYVDKILKGAKPADLPVEQPPSSSWSQPEDGPSPRDHVSPDAPDTGGRGDQVGVGRGAGWGGAHADGVHQGGGVTGARAPQPNHRLQATLNNLRSSLAPAIERA